MRKYLSSLKARGAVIVGHGVMLKVLFISIALAIVAFIAVAAYYM